MLMNNLGVVTGLALHEINGGGGISTCNEKILPHLFYYNPSLIFIVSSFHFFFS
jgi:hypothetical protein